MNHEQNKEQIELLFYDELSGQEREKAEIHLRTCNECRVFFDELKKLHGVLAQYSPVEVNDRLLNDARVDLQSAIRDERNKQSWLDRLIGTLDNMVGRQTKIALGGVITIAIGFFLGYLAFKTPPGQSVQPRQPEVRQVTNAERPLLPEGGQITNVKFIDSDIHGGNVDFTFDAVMPMHLKGKVNDSQIQQVLSYALLNEQNPGVRLRSVSAMASEQAVHWDDDVKHVLITALKSDDNPGVRKEALNVLQKFRFDDDIKQAFMNALAHDSNSAIRIAAINALDSTKFNGITPDQDLLDMFKEKMKSDNNPYVRIRAKTALQEIAQ